MTVLYFILNLWIAGVSGVRLGEAMREHDFLTVLFCFLTIFVVSLSNQRIWEYWRRD